jgi:hypothetical protein
MAAKQAHEGKMENRMKRWGAKLDTLVTNAEVADAEARKDYRKGIDTLISKHRKTESKLVELRAARSEEWGTVMTGVESAWNDLEDAFRTMSKNTRSLMMPAKRVAPKAAAPKATASKASPKKSRKRTSRKGSSS